MRKRRGKSQPATPTSSPNQRATRSQVSSPMAVPLDVQSRQTGPHVMEPLDAENNQKLSQMRGQVVHYKQQVISRLIELKSEMAVVKSPKHSTPAAQLREKITSPGEIRTTPRKKHIRRFSTAPRDYGQVLEFNRTSITSCGTKTKTSPVKVAKVTAQQVTSEDAAHVYANALQRKQQLITQLSSVTDRALASRLPVYPQPVAHKSHWDFVLEEMKWLATDFIQERRWKQATSYYISKEAANKIHEDAIHKETQKRSAARAVAMKVSSFWRSIERVAARARLREDTEHRGGADSESQSQNVAAAADSAAIEGDTVVLNDPALKKALGKLQALEHNSSGTFEELLAKLPLTLPPHRKRALEWMLSMHEQKTHFCLNDQYGLAKASTVCAFLKCIESSTAGRRKPHLVVVQAHSLHKWIHFVKQWFPQPSLKLVVYGGNRMQKRAQQRTFSDDDVTDNVEQQVDFVLCYHHDLIQDKVHFVTQTWACVVVEAPGEKILTHGDLSIQKLENERKAKLWSVLKNISCGDRRILVSHTVPTNDDVTRTQWLHFLGIVPNCMKAFDCVSLRRLRSQIERELHKLDEQSAVCPLTTLQATAYRDWLLNAGLYAALESGEVAPWLRLILRLRGICNGVDLLGKIDKICHADIRTMEACSGKIAVLGTLLLKLKEEQKRIVIYAQMGDMLELVEFYVGLLRMTSVRITGDETAQQVALCHFSLRTQVQVAIVSTRCAASPADGTSCSSECSHAVTVYGANAVIVLDSDWDPIVDAKIRASWQHYVVEQDLVVYRFHSEGSVETSMLRSGSCLTEKLFGEVSTRSLIRGTGSSVLPVENIPAERPKWWTSIKSKDLLGKASEVAEEYIGEPQLNFTLSGGAYQDLDSEEHMLLSNTDELMPIEWYGVNVMQSAAKAAADEIHDIESLPMTSEESQEMSETFDLFGTCVLCHTKKTEQSIDPLYYDHGVDGTEADRLGWMSSQFNKLRLQGFDVDYQVYHMSQDSILRTQIRDAPAELGFNYIYQVKPQPVKAKKESNSQFSSIKPIKIKKRLGSSASSKNGDTRALLLEKRKRGGLTAEEKAQLKRHRLNPFDPFANDSLLGNAFGEDEMPPAIDEFGVLDMGENLSKNAKKLKSSSSSKSQSKKASSELAREVWTTAEDRKLLKLRDVYGANWNLICCLLNDSATSCYGTRTRSGRQCSERYVRLTSQATQVSKSPAFEVHGSGLLLTFGHAMLIPSIDATPSLPPLDDIERKDMSIVFSHVMTAMRGKRPPPAVPGTESSSRNASIVRPHPSHAQATGSASGTTMSPEQVVERSKQAALASKEITGKESVPSKHGGTTYGSTLQAISARVSGGDRRGSNSSSSLPSGSGSSSSQAGARPDGNAVTTSTLLYVIDRMPGIKSQIQQVLQRTDRTEAQKVEMIARLLKNTNTKTTTPSTSTSGSTPAAVAPAPAVSVVPTPVIAAPPPPPPPSTAIAAAPPSTTSSSSSSIRK